jgi:acetylornithine deacetylase/succinyl-diaminopimelate desuccinylase-like protein
MDAKIAQLAENYRPLAVTILKEAIRVPADFVDRPKDDGGDPLCGLSNHERPRLEYLRRMILEIGAAERAEDVRYDAFGNLRWTVRDRNDRIPDAQKSVILWDGHTDTVRALRDRWRDAIGGGIDAYDGLKDWSKVDRSFLRRELGYLPPEDEWQNLVFGRGAADQLSGVISQIVATKILLETRGEGSLRGAIVDSVATVAEEDNDGGGSMFIMRKELAGAAPERIPDVVILTEGTGCSQQGAVGIYRGQRGRMQIEVEVIGKSCHGSMPWEGRNPLEYGAPIIAEAADRYARGEGFAKDAFLGPGTRTASWAVLDSPSDCAVPERFTFRFDRRLTAGEEPEQARQDFERMTTVARAREAGLTVNVRVPFYSEKTWCGYTPGNPQVYPGWVTPEDHPAIVAAVDAYQRVVSPKIAAGGGGDGASRSREGAARGASGGTAGALRKEPRVARWIFSTDGVGFPLRRDETPFDLAPSKRWVGVGPYWHPAMFGVGPGIEQNTHKIGECVDAREISAVIALLARFPSAYRAHL